MLGMVSGATVAAIALTGKAWAIVLLIALAAAALLGAVSVFQWHHVRRLFLALDRRFHGAGGGDASAQGRQGVKAELRAARIREVGARLELLCSKLGELCGQAEEDGDEEPLKGWKGEAKRFLDANLASDKVTPFHALASEVTRYESNQPRDHIRSSCAEHRRFLRELHEDVVAGYEPVTEEEAPSGRGIPPTKSFIYRSE